MKTLRALLLLLGVGLWSQAALSQVNPFGDSLDLKESDIAMLQAAANALFQDDHAQIGRTEAWSNPKTGNSGTVSLVELFKHAGLPWEFGLAETQQVLVRNRLRDRIRV